MLFLSFLSPCPVPTEIAFGALPEEKIPDNWGEFPLQYPLFTLYREYGVPLAEYGIKENKQQVLMNTPVPVSRSASASQLALESVRMLLECDRHLRAKSLYLIYAHETTEPSYYLTPCLLLKKSLSLKQIIPFAVTCGGSCVFTHALEMLDLLNPADTCSEDSPPSILVVADQVCPPQPRGWFNYYPKGDAAIACKVSTAGGHWAVIDGASDVWPLDTANPYLWTFDHHTQHEHYLLKRCRKQLKRFLEKNARLASRIKLAIPQMLSAAFIRHLAACLQDCPLYQRTYAPACNLLGSDCFVSLHEVEQKQLIARHECVLLISAGPLVNLSFLLLQKT